MPLYEIRHNTPLTQTQRTQLAAQITELHSSTFSVPSLFVNVHFYGPLRTSSNSTSTEKEKEKEKQETPPPSTFVAGKPVAGNTILGYQRPRQDPTGETTSRMLTRLAEIWDSVVANPNPDPNSNTDTDTTTPTKKSTTTTTPRLDNPLSLHTIYLFGAISGGWKIGFEIPPAGDDGGWVGRNRAEIERRAAEEGDQAMREMLVEVGERFGVGS